MTLRRMILDRLRRPTTWWGWSCTRCGITGPLFPSVAECHDDLEAAQVAGPPAGPRRHRRHLDPLPGGATAPPT